MTPCQVFTLALLRVQECKDALAQAEAEVRELEKKHGPALYQRESKVILLRRKRGKYEALDE
jgi:hypothetical protein